MLVAIISVLFALALIGFPLLLVLYASGQYPSWRRRAEEFRKKRRDDSEGSASP